MARYVPQSGGANRTAHNHQISPLCDMGFITLSQSEVMETLLKPFVHKGKTMSQNEVKLISPKTAISFTSENGILSRQFACRKTHLQQADSVKSLYSTGASSARKCRQNHAVDSGFLSSCLHQNPGEFPARFCGAEPFFAPLFGALIRAQKQHLKVSCLCKDCLQIAP